MQQLIYELRAHADCGYVPNGTCDLLRRAAIAIEELERMANQSALDDDPTYCLGSSV